MKLLGRLSTALFLCAILTQATFGGEIHIGKADPPPDPPPATTPGDIQLPDNTPRPGAGSATVTDVALNLLQELLLVF